MAVKSRLKKGGAILAVAVALIGGFEGLRTKSYKDAVGVPTICYGETLGVKMGQTKTVRECRDMFESRLIEFSSKLDKCIKDPERIPDETYVALLSWAYNVGTGAACKSTLVRKVNAGDLQAACGELKKWNKAGGRVLNGLTIRRAKETTACLNGLRSAGVTLKTVPTTENVSAKKEPANTPTTNEHGSRTLVYLSLGIIAIIGIVGAVILRRRK